MTLDPSLLSCTSHDFVQKLSEKRIFATNINTYWPELHNHSLLGYLCTEYSSVHDFAKKISHLITIGANPNAFVSAYSGYTPLTYLCNQEKYSRSLEDAVNVLLKHGASATLADKAFHGGTALHYIARNKSMRSLLPILKKYNVLIEQELFNILTSNANGARLKRFLDGMEGFYMINKTSATNNETALHLTVGRGYDKLVKLLVAVQGINLDQKTANGKGAIHVLFTKPLLRSLRRDILRLLLDHGASIQLQDNEGKTALHLAVQEGDEDTVRLLCLYGISKDILDSHGKKAVSYTSNQAILHILHDVKSPVKSHGVLFTDAKYVKAIETLKVCPTKLNRFFINNSMGNCWIDAITIGCTFSQDLGKVLRAVLHGYLKKMQASNIRHPDGLFSMIKTWKVSNAWQTYVTRILLLLLLGADAEDWLTCPIVTQHVKGAREVSFIDVSQTVDQLAGIKQHGGFPVFVFRILSALLGDEYIVASDTYSYHTGTYLRTSYLDPHFTDSDTLSEAIKSYPHQVSIYTIMCPKQKDAHAITAFFCNGKVFFYDDNAGVFEIPHATMLPTKIERVSDSTGETKYVMKFGPSQVYTVVIPGKYTANETWSLSYCVRIHARPMYETLKRDPRKFKVSASHPTPQRLSPVTPEGASLNEQLCAVILGTSPTKLSQIKNLVERGADPNVGMKIAYNALVPDIVEYFISKGAKWEPDDLYAFATTTNSSELLSMAKTEIRKEIQKAKLAGDHEAVNAILAIYDLGECPPDKIINPTTGRCVNRDSAVGRLLIARGQNHTRKVSKAKTKSKAKTPECPPDKILNPTTRRCVKRDSAIGRLVLKRLEGL